jgi:hypothetical protein
MNEQELFSSGVMEQLRRAVTKVLDEATAELIAGVIGSVLDTLTVDVMPNLNPDDCSPHGIERPLIVNGEIVDSCHHCEQLWTGDELDVTGLCPECVLLD